MSKAGAVPGGPTSEEAVRDEDFSRDRIKISETEKEKVGER